MLIVTINEGHATSATSEWPKNDEAGFREGRYQNRNDWKTFERAEQVAAELTQATGQIYLATDSGPHVSPRYDVVQPPAVGDDVSYGFNGDYYPCGKVEKVSADQRIITTTGGRRWWRVRKSGSWKEGGAEGTWSLVRGVHDRRNPEF